jgi:hypothetical protein
VLFCSALVLAVSALGAQGTPAGTVIRSWVNVSFTLGGVNYTDVSDTVSRVVAEVAGADMQPPRI